MVFAGCKRNADANIAAEKQNHAALDVACVFSWEVAFLRNFAGDNERADEKRSVSRDNRDGRPFENAEQMERIRDEHDGKWDNQNPRGTLVRIACARVTVNEKCLHNHKEANAKQRVIAAVLQNVCVVVHDFQAEIRAQSHSETRLQKVAVALAKAIPANEEYDNRHNGGNSELGDVLVVTALDETLLDSTAVVKYKPVSHEECNHENSDDN